MILNLVGSGFPPVLESSCFLVFLSREVTRGKWRLKTTHVIYNFLSIFWVSLSLSLSIPRRTIDEILNASDSSHRSTPVPVPRSRYRRFSAVWDRMRSRGQRLRRQRQPPGLSRPRTPPRSSRGGLPPSSRRFLKIPMRFRSRVLWRSKAKPKIWFK